MTMLTSVFQTSEAQLPAGFVQGQIESFHFLRAHPGECNEANFLKSGEHIRVKKHASFSTTLDKGLQQFEVGGWKRNFEIESKSIKTP